MASVFTRLVVDPEDLRAHRRDLLAIFRRYGLSEDVAPHNRAAFDKEIARAQSVLRQCFRAE